MKDDASIASAASVEQSGATLPVWESLSPAARKILDAGVTQFAASGFLATTIRDVTAACGLTAPSFYNHFESKTALLYEIANAANVELDRRLSQLPTPASARESLNGLVRTLVTFNLEHPKEARVSNREWGYLEGDVREEVAAHRRDVRSLFEQALDSPQVKRGLLDSLKKPVVAETEPRLLAMSIVNLCNVAPEWYHAEGPLTIGEVAEAHCRLAERMAGFGDRRRKS